MSKKKIRHSKDHQRCKFPNGVVLLTERARHFQTLALGVWVRRGARDESPRCHGMAHFLEHMLFKGTSRRTALEIAREVDLRGGEFNAMTTKEYTSFFIILPAQEFDFGVDLLAEVLRDSRFEEIEIERERSVVLQELAGMEENPEDFIHDSLLELAYPNHPLGRSILGSEKSVRSFSRKTLTDFFHANYHARNIVFTCAGDVDPRRVREKVRVALGSFPARREPRLKSSPPKFVPGTHAIRRDFDQNHLLIGYEAFPIRHRARLAVFLMNSFLGGGMSSALFQSVRETSGLAYTVYSSLMGHRDSGILCIYAALGKDNIATCMRLIQEEIDKLIRRPLPEEDLRIVKNAIKSAIRLGADSMETRMTALARSELYFERHLSNEELCAEVDSVRASEIQAAAKSVFAKKPITVLLGNMSRKDLERAVSAGR